MAGANRLRQYQDRRAALVKEMAAISAKAADEDRDLTTDEEAAFDELSAEAKSLDPKIEREQRLLEHQASVARIVATSSCSDTQVGNPNPAWLKDPKCGFSSHREFFATILTSVDAGEVTDERLRSLATAGSDEQSTFANPYGGFLIPEGFTPNLKAIAAEVDPTAGRTMAVPMTSPVVGFPARVDKVHTSSVSGGLRVYRRAESQTVSSSLMEMELVKLEATPLMGLSYATEELLARSPISFAALLDRGFRDEFASKILNEKIRGTGVGQMEGVLSSPALVSVAKETGQDADSLVYENVIKMRARCWGYQNAVWLYNHDCLPQLMQLVMVIGTSGVPMWQNSAREGEPDMLLGRPAFPCEYCGTVGDQGDLILGNWAEYLEGTLTGLQRAESIHVRFVNNERTFRFLMENDGKCWWRSALTPKKSTSTLSPFVVLDARA